MKSILTISFFVFFLVSIDSHAQTEAKKDTSVSIPSSSKTPSQNLDTEESLKYVGSQLFFQLKKRLHLTDEEEEKKHAKNEKVKKLSFFGIEIERD